MTGLLSGYAQADSRADALDIAIPARLAKETSPTPLPGAIVGIWWDDGREPYVRTFGVADMVTGEPMTTDMYMRIGSNTKSFTITAILMLADKGLLNLDDPIDDYVKGVPGGKRVTLRHLAEMRSGLYDYSRAVRPLVEDNPHRRWKPRELLEIIFDQGREGPHFVFPPGFKFDYNNPNTVLLGEVVKNITGQEIGAFITERILIPTGLTHTLYPKHREFPSPYAHGYWQMLSGAFVDGTDVSPTWGGAAGQMISTLDDLRVWAHIYAVGKLISPAMKREQQKFLPADDEGVGAKYGLGIENQNGWLGHNGNIFSYMVFPYYLPEEGITMVVMLNSGANVAGAWRLMQDITAIITPNHPWTGLQ
jgi:D-alanyl-D-alanine carboxypeptidase